NPMLPGSKYRVHDMTRPQPRVVTPGEKPGDPPSDAVILFDGTDLSKWVGKKDQPAQWKVENGYMEAVPKSGSIRTKDSFGDCQLHIEWATPAPAKGQGQGRGNSGVFLMGRYEIQVLDCYHNTTYPDGMTAAIYGQSPPLVNACRKPGEWQTYDIIWIAPRFKGSKLVSPARVTVFQNGVLVHHDKELLGTTRHKRLPQYQPHGPTGPLMLQDHGNPIRYRNIWYRPLTDYDQTELPPAEK
ncbi:MAG: DUF1080 domain-containing protein, partial [Planctomycetes bacterium]|nr:DUF1080 domain-containing protein [Planctomycetota bacterium]